MPDNPNPLTTKHTQGGSNSVTNYEAMQNASTAFNVRGYSNMHGYGGAGTGSFDFSTMSDLTGSGGGGGWDESLELDSGIPLTKRNPMLRKNVTGYHSGGRVSPYKYNNRALRYAQGGVTPQQESNDGAMWANMAARLGQKNADIALLQTQKIIQGNGKGNPYQMPEQRGMMPNAQFAFGGIYADKLQKAVTDYRALHQEAPNVYHRREKKRDAKQRTRFAFGGQMPEFPDQQETLNNFYPSPQKSTKNPYSMLQEAMRDMNYSMNEALGVPNVSHKREKRPAANQGMKMEMSNKEKLNNLLKAIPNEEAYNKLSEKEKAAFDKTWVKYGGVSKKKKKFTSGGRF